MDSEVGRRNGVTSMQLLPCSKQHSFENGGDDEKSNQKTEMILVDGVRTYKRRKHSQSSSEGLLEHAINSVEGGGGQSMEKNSVKEHIGTTSDGSCNEPDNQANIQVNTELCQHIFNDVIVSEKFDMLSKLLSENIKGIKIESFSHFNIINSRIRDGVYGHSPQRFSEDIQQLWSTIEKIGVELVTLGKGLSDMSRKFCHDQGINQAHPGNLDCPVLDTTKQYPSVEADGHSKPDQAESAKSCICGCCGGKTDNRTCIVCDSCEKMYHIFCVGVSVGKDSPRNWYCVNCVGTGLESPHHNCVVCARASDPGTGRHIDEDRKVVINHAGQSSLHEKSNCFTEADVVQQSSIRITSHSCKLCKCEFHNNQYRECEHYLCSNKFHLRCLSDIELKRFGPRWYCTSCLCRVCLVDRDDEKIVLCDGCDNAYHIYCMEPPCASIPEGKWFCKLCDTRRYTIRKAKRVVENNEKSNGGGVNIGVGMPLTAKRVYEKHNIDWKKGVSGKVNTAVGSMDILLSAAETLNNAEKTI